VPRSPSQKKIDARYFVPALARGLEILSCFTVRESALPVSDLAARLGLERGSVYRLAYTLTQLGYLEFDENTKRYSPSTKVLTLAANATSGMALTSAALPHLKELSARFNETVSLATLIGNQAVIVHRIESAQILTARFQLWSSLPVYCSSLGKTLLAYLPPEDAKKILASVEFVRLTPRTMTSISKLLQNFAEIRNCGYGLNDEEMTPGLIAAAAPIWQDAKVIGVVDLSTLLSRIPREQVLSQVAPAVVQTANLISNALHRPT
jgi:DNA-binding IclR family transcriptional regulator